VQQSQEGCREEVAFGQHLKVVKEGPHSNLEKSGLGRGSDICQGPEVGTGLIC
jgi:hypothetical protein